MYFDGFGAFDASEARPYNTNTTRLIELEGFATIEFVPLTLYRRHTKSCIKGYQQNHRVFFPTTKNLTRLDCQCPIAAEGKLGQEYITNRSLQTNEWKAAQTKTAQWDEWGQTTQPEIEDVDNPTVRYAVDSFMASVGPQGRNIEKNSVAQYAVLLHQRLLPYCELKTYVCMREFDSLDVCSKFVESWVNLNPTKYRKNVPLPTKPVPLADSTKKVQLELLRIFFKYCMDREWMSHNQAKEIHIKTKTAAKFGMEPQEEEWFFDEINRLTDGHYQTGQENAIELRTFCMSMRHAGLRISDAVNLDETSLVPRASGEGWAMKIYQKKTKEWVYIPIPAFVESALRKLPIKGEKDGKRYWFWTCVGTQKSAINNFYMRIIKIVNRVIEEKGPITHLVTPHTFRHTFSIRHLNAGVDIKIVSRWLGHKSITVTEKHYAHAVHGTMLASEEAHDVSMRRQEEIAAKRKRHQLTVVG
jgi:site-specific recombinase XerD